MKRCGERDRREQRYATITQRVAGGRAQIAVAVEQWTFNLGPTRFMRMLTSRNGDLIEIRTGENGVK